MSRNISEEQIIRSHLSRREIPRSLLQRAVNSNWRNKLFTRAHLIRFKASSLQQYKKEQTTLFMSLSSPPLTQSSYFPWSWTLANINSHSLNIRFGFLTPYDRTLQSLICLHFYSFSHTTGTTHLKTWNMELYYINTSKDLVINTRLPFIL